MIVDFDFLFRANDDGTYTAKVPIDIPGQVQIKEDTILESSEITGFDPVKELAGKKLEVEQENIDGTGYYVIKAEIVD